MNTNQTTSESPFPASASDLLLTKAGNSAIPDSVIWLVDQLILEWKIYKPGAPVYSSMVYRWVMSDFTRKYIGDVAYPNSPSLVARILLRLPIINPVTCPHEFCAFQRTAKRHNRAGLAETFLPSETNWAHHVHRKFNRMMHEIIFSSGSFNNIEGLKEELWKIKSDTRLFILPGEDIVHDLAVKAFALTASFLINDSKWI